MDLTANCGTIVFVSYSTVPIADVLPITDSLIATLYLVTIFQKKTFPKRVSNLDPPYIKSLL